MTAEFGSLRAETARCCMVAILLLSLCINVIGITWGLPNAEGAWAADALRPTAPLAVARHMFGGDRPNSGWFYFKYPLGHPLVLTAAEAPYLAWLRLTRQFQKPTNTYPYGFRHPERALLVLALVTRAVSAVMGVAFVALAYVISAALFGSLAGVLSAVLVSGCYPMVFYAHTSNVDVPLLCWIAVAVTLAVLGASRDSKWTSTAVGVAMAMALLTKEQSLGVLAVIPLVWLWRRHGERGLLRRDVLGHVLYAAAGFVLTTALVGDWWWNPLGYINRWRFLLGTLPAAVRDQYAPYQFQVQVPKSFSLASEAGRLLKVAAMTAHSVTIPVLLLCVAGVLVTVWRRPRQAAVLLLLLSGYYLLSLRATALLQVRYTMPFLYFLLLFGGAGAAALVQRVQAWGQRGLVAAAAVAIVALAVLPAFEIDRLLLRDPRYDAERWLREHAGAHARVETYEPATYLPRFGPELAVAQVPVQERTVELLRQRQPDLVVVSSGGRAGLTGRYVKDWKPGMPILAEVDAAKEFFARLRDEQLGYRQVARFRTRTWWIDPHINSLNPEITIFARTEEAQVVKP